VSGEAGATLDGEYFRLFIGSGVSVNIAVEPGRDAVGDYFARANAPYLAWLARAQPALEALFTQLVAGGLPLARRVEWRGPDVVLTDYALLGQHRTLRLRVNTRAGLDGVLARVAAVLRLVEPHGSRVDVPTRFEDASPRSILYLDEQGNVAGVSRAQRIRGQLLRTGVIWAPLAGVASLIALGSAAWPLLLAGSIAGGWMRLRTLHWNDVGWAYLRQKQGELAEAAHRAQKLVASPLVGRRQRIAAQVILASVALERGEHEVALENLGAARRLRRGPLTPNARTCDLAEASALATLGRLAEARALLGPLLAEEPAGDYLRYSQWSAELHVAFCEGAHALSHAELERRVPALNAPVARTHGPAVLAWAFAQLGDLDRARALLLEAFNRSDEGFERRAPKLWRWMEQHAHWATPASRL
jgi:hypothetical protein